MVQTLKAVYAAATAIVEHPRGPVEPELGYVEGRGRHQSRHRQRTAGPVVLIPGPRLGQPLRLHPLERPGVRGRARHARAAGAHLPGAGVLRPGRDPRPTCSSLESSAMIGTRPSSFTHAGGPVTEGRAEETSDRLRVPRLRRRRPFCRPRRTPAAREEVEDARVVGEQAEDDPHQEPF